MTFESKESSRHAGNPVELYRFVWGPGVNDYYAYTNAETAITFDGIDYAPLPIGRGAVQSSGTLDKSSMTVSLPSASDAVELFRVYPPSQEVSLFILQGHYDDADAEFLVVWTGRVLGCKWSGTEASLTCEPIARSMKRTGLRRHWQYSCPHALYHGGCGAVKANALHPGTVVSTSGNTVTLAAGWQGTSDPLKFRGGPLEWVNADGNTETRTILRVSGDTLTLSGLVRDLAADDSVSVYLGCNHQMSDCEDLHDAIQDFGGDPWIPVKNPFGVRNNYY